jgi:anti-sigma B factor antagonist
MTELADIQLRIASDRAGTANSLRPAVVLAVAGEVDIATWPKLVRQLHALMDAGERQVVVDMSAVEFIDASGIGALVGAASMARDAGGTIALTRPSCAVLRLLDIMGLDGVLSVMADTQAAYDAEGTLKAL